MSYNKMSVQKLLPAKADEFSEGRDVEPSMIVLSQSAEFSILNLSWALTFSEISVTNTTEAVITSKL